MFPKIIISDYCQNKFQAKGYYDKPTNTILIFEQSCFDDGLNYKWVKIHELTHYIIDNINPINKHLMKLTKKYLKQCFLNGVSYEEMVTNMPEEKLCNKIANLFYKQFIKIIE
jgi:antirestriction protein ArdC